MICPVMTRPLGVQIAPAADGTTHVIHEVPKVMCQGSRCALWTSDKDYRDGLYGGCGLVHHEAAVWYPDPALVDDPDEHAQEARREDGP